MEKTIVNYSLITQIAPLLQSLENNTSIKFSTRIKIMDLAEPFTKHYDRFKDELKLLIGKYGEFGSDGNPLPVEGGGVKIKQEFVEACSKAVQELYSTQTPIEFESVKLPEDLFDTFQGDREAMRFIQKYFVEA